MSAYIEASQGPNAVDFYSESIQATEDQWEMDTRLLLTPKTIAMMPTPEEEYDILEDAVNFHRAGRQIMPRFRLRFLPVREIVRVRFALAANDTIIEYPQDWIRPSLRLGIVNLIPYRVASPALASGSATWINMFAAGAMGSDGWPHLIDVRYTAGYDAEVADGAIDPPAPQWPMKMHIKQALAKDAAWRVAGACRRDIPDTITLDGFSQHFISTDKYLEDLHNEFLAFQSKYMRQERPINMGVM